MSRGWLLGARLVMGKVEMNDGPLDDAVLFTMEAMPGRVSEGVGMKWRSVGGSGAAWACSRESAAQSSPTHPNAPLRPHNTLPGAVIGNTVGNSFKQISPNSRHEDRQHARSTLNGANVAVPNPTTVPRDHTNHARHLERPGA